MSSGGTKPPSPPAAPTSPVTPPTRAGSVLWEISANVAPDPAPRAAAITRNATVPRVRLLPSDDVTGGFCAATAAHAVTTANDADSTGIDPKRSDSHPPTGRITTATTTNPAIR